MLPLDSARPFRPSALDTALALYPAVRLYLLIQPFAKQLLSQGTTKWTKCDLHSHLNTHNDRSSASIPYCVYSPQRLLQITKHAHSILA
jgi:hypothetical protein